MCRWRNGHLAVAPHVKTRPVAALADALEFHDLLGDEDEVVDDAAVAARESRRRS